MAWDGLMWYDFRDTRSRICFAFGRIRRVCVVVVVVVLVPGCTVLYHIVFWALLFFFLFVTWYASPARGAGSFQTYMLVVRFSARTLGNTWISWFQYALLNVCECGKTLCCVLDAVF
ncbi:hypothetical protein P153DRAFT_81839 [Dothidotthia symphoricarpi CBS 119687]|uniref:Uncharacterized protein n=1 Tax=Dothidotthia symphoricarpi CBS 119687 TaxID=1392245 RepID=A0A6A6A659_9PLEO|nr:uncharacterized protein P153DRAFT_81839 [Dothidotthia symphoricarpi CBS 119687]KAF2126665.1 hypothetical protein P153DRAFT_81839 [Dothidotthia symphoricarpi CBS 119687]